MKTTCLLLLVLATAFSASAQLTGEARLLKEKRDAKVAEIDKIYRAELEKIKLKELQNRNTAAVTAIQAELGEDASATVEFSPSSIIGKWRRVAVSPKMNGQIFEFTDEKGGTYNGASLFKVRYNAATKTISIDSGEWVDKITATDNPETLKGVTDSGITYELVRVR